MAQEDLEFSKKRLGILVSCVPTSASWKHVEGLTLAGLERKVTVFLYFVGPATEHLENPLWADLSAKGVRVYAFGRSVRERRLDVADWVVLSGLSMLSDIVTKTDRFLSFA